MFFSSRRARWILCLSASLAISACGKQTSERVDATSASPSASSPPRDDEARVEPASEAHDRARVLAPSRRDCETVRVFAAGAPAGSICEDDAAKNGLTVVDLSDAWTPRVFAPDATTHDAPAYRAKYLELA